MLGNAESDEAKENAPSPISVRPVSTPMDSSFLQPPNADAPIFFTVFGNDITLRDAQL